MVMVRSSRPSALTAGKMFDISLQAFCDVSFSPLLQSESPDLRLPEVSLYECSQVCKTSAAYFNFIRMITE